MPKTLPLLILFFLAVSMTPASAQRARVDRVGLKLGGSLAQYRGKDTFVGNGNLVGYCGGAMLHLPVSPVFSVQPELLYSQKGAVSQYFVLSSTTSASGNQRLDYLEAPVLAKLRSRIGLFVEAGPTFAYLLNARIVDQQTNFDNRGDFKAFELGYAAGVGFQTKEGFMLGTRYTRGLTSLFKAGAYRGRGINGEAEVYNQVFQLYVGLIFFGRSPADFL